MASIDEFREFVAPYYAKKDMMHDLSHIELMLAAACKLALTVYECGASATHARENLTTGASPWVLV